MVFRLHGTTKPGHQTRRRHSLLDGEARRRWRRCGCGGRISGAASPTATSPAVGDGTSPEDSEESGCRRASTWHRGRIRYICTRVLFCTIPQRSKGGRGNLIGQCKGGSDWTVWECFDTWAADGTVWGLLASRFNFFYIHRHSHHVVITVLQHRTGWMSCLYNTYIVNAIPFLL